MGLPFGGGDSDEQQVYNPLVEAVNLWDISEKPTTNDRIKKLGAQLPGLAQAVAKFDDDSFGADFAEGLGTDKEASKIASRRFWEPDNFVLRLHEEKGRGKDSVWALRLITDHANFAKTRACRSTMVTDQDETQGWAWLSDMTWLVDLGTSVQDDELAFNGAGFLEQLYGQKVATKSRSALAVNMAGNAGFVTQGSMIGQLHHALVLVSPGGGTVGAHGARPITKTELALRGDVHFYMRRGSLAQFCDEQESPKENDYDEPREVHFYVSKFAAPPMAWQDAALDTKSNHKQIERPGAVMWRGWVKVPRPGKGDEKYDYSWHHPPPPKPGSGSGGDPSKDKGKGERAPAGNKDGKANPDNKPVDPKVDDTEGPYPFDPYLYEVDENGELAPIDDRATSMQTQCGYPPAASPAFTQLVNVLPHPASGDEHTHVTANWTLTKPDGYRDLLLTTYLKVSAEIAEGQSVSLELKIGIYVNDTPPANHDNIYSRLIVLDHDTPYGPSGEYQAIRACFTGLPKDKTKVKVWFERLSELGTIDPDQDANVEAWVLSHDPEWMN